MKKVFEGGTEKERDEFYAKLDHKFSIRMWKALYRFTDALSVRPHVPFFGRISLDIRRAIARKISPNISKKAFIEKGATIATGVYVEPHGCIGLNCVIGHEVHIGEHTMMGPNVHIYSNQHAFDIANINKHFFGGYHTKPVYIGKHSWIGYGTIMTGGSGIGDFSTVGAGAVVTKDFSKERGVLIAGNPAVIKKNYFEGIDIDKILNEKE